MKQVMMIVGFSLVLASCASLQPDECKTANWEQLGYADAMDGRDGMLTPYGKDCGKVGITPNKWLYMRGYDKGAKAFCTYDNGKKVGRVRHFYGSICDKPGLAEPFKKGYEEGLAQYRIREMNRKLMEDLEKRRKEQESSKQAASGAGEKARLATEARLKLGIKTEDMTRRITDALKTQPQN